MSVMMSLCWTLVHLPSYVAMRSLSPLLGLLQVLQLPGRDHWVQQVLPEVLFWWRWRKLESLGGASSHEHHWKTWSSPGFSDQGRNAPSMWPSHHRITWVGDWLCPTQDAVPRWPLDSGYSWLPRWVLVAALGALWWRLPLLQSWPSSLRPLVGWWWWSWSKLHHYGAVRWRGAHLCFEWLFRKATCSHSRWKSTSTTSASDLWSEAAGTQQWLPQLHHCRVALYRQGDLGGLLWSCSYLIFGRLHGSSRRDLQLWIRLGLWLEVPSGWVSTTSWCWSTWWVVHGTNLWPMESYAKLGGENPRATRSTTRTSRMAPWDSSQVREDSLSSTSSQWCPRPHRTTSSRYLLEDLFTEVTAWISRSVRSMSVWMQVLGRWWCLETHQETYIQTTKKYLFDQFHRRCPGDHQHCPLEGSAPGLGRRTQFMEDYQPGLSAVIAAALVFDETPLVADYVGAVNEDRVAMTGIIQLLTTNKPEAVRTVQRLHRNLGHPDPSHLAELLESRGASSVVVETAKTYHCAACQRYKKPNSSAPAQLPTAETFNHIIQSDVLWLKLGEKKIPILSMVDTATKYQAGAVVYGEKTSDFLHAWKGAGSGTLVVLLFWWPTRAEAGLPMRWCRGQLATTSNTWYLQEKLIPDSLW